MWVETQPSAQSSFHKLNVGNSCQKTRKIRYYIFEVLPILYFFTLCQIFSPGLKHSKCMEYCCDFCATARYNKAVYVSSVLLRTARLWSFQFADVLKAFSR